MGWLQRRRIRSQIFSEIARIGGGEDADVRSHLTVALSGDGAVLFVDTSMIHVFGSGSFHNPAGDDPTALAYGHDRLFWEGSVDEALERLATVGDGSGPRALWRSFCSKLPAAALWSELKRIAVTGPGSVEERGFENPYEISYEEMQRYARERGWVEVAIDVEDPEDLNALLSEDESLLSEESEGGDSSDRDGVTHDVTFGEEEAVSVESKEGLDWSGSLDEAVERVRSLPDNAGLEAFWGAFRDS